MFTSDKRSVFLTRAALGHLAAAALCALFGTVYERFSHGVYSYYMIYAFALPMMLGALPLLLLALRGRAIPGRTVLWLWNGGDRRADHRLPLPRRAGHLRHDPSADDRLSHRRRRAAGCRHGVRVGVIGGKRAARGDAKADAAARALRFRMISPEYHIHFFRLNQIRQTTTMARETAMTTG